MRNRFSIPAVTYTALLAAVGLTMILMPFGAGQAQSPARPQTNNPLGATADQAQDPSAQQDLAAKLHALQQQRDDLASRIKQLELSIRRLKPDTKPQAPAPVERLADPNAAARKPAPAVNQYGYRAASKPSGSVEQRLEQVEKKLDTLLWEFTNLRRDLAKPGRANIPMATPPAVSGPTPGVNPLPRTANPYANPAAPTPALAPGPARPAQPVEPPSRPGNDALPRTLTPPTSAPPVPVVPGPPNP